MLGAGPLSRTYLNTARVAIEECDKKEIYNYITKKIKLSYNGYNILKNRVEEYENREEVIIANCNFGENVELEILIVDFQKDNIEKMIEEISYGS